MLNLLKKLKEILHPKDKAKLLILLLFMVFAGLLEALSIGIVAGFVAIVADSDILFNMERIGPLLEFLGIENSRDILIYGTVLLIFIFITKNSYLIFYKYIKSRFVFNRYKSISVRLFNIYMNVPYSFHLRRNSADLIRNVTSETRMLANNVLLPILQIMAEGIIALSIVILLFAFEPAVTIMTLVILGGVSVLFLKATKNSIRKHGKKALEERTGVIKTVNEGIGGFKDATIMNRQFWFIEKFKKSISALSRAHIFTKSAKESVRPVVETIAVTGMLLIAVVLLWRGYSIASLASILALFALSIQRLLPAIHNIVEQYTSLRYNLYSVDPIYKDLVNLKKYDKKEKDKEEERISLKEKIELKNVRYTYPGSREVVLRDVSLAIPKGLAVGFVGATGSGKTTLVDLILGLLEPVKGNVYIDGKEIKENLRAWQRNIGYIPQFIYLSDDTICNNIAFGLNKEDIDKKRVEKAVKAAQLDDFIKRLPEGIDTIIGERGIRLSGGQKQRIGIARALYNDPEVLVMDEATSSLDNVTEKFVIEAIEKLKQDRTVIIIAHRLTTVKNCDKLYILKEGKIVSEGNYEELLRNNEDFKLMADYGK